MKISIITVCYNSEKTIEDTIKSVLSQTYKDYEYILVDGKSSDNTLEIINRYKNSFNDRMTIVSEKDNGLYDAMNKGIKLAKGDIIATLNADDILANENVFETVVNNFDKATDIVYADIKYCNEDFTKVIRDFVSGTKNSDAWCPAHPSMYVRRSVFEKIGTYNLKYRIAADFDFMVRCNINNVNYKYVNEYFVLMRYGGKSNGLAGYIKNFNECYRVLKNNGVEYPLSKTIRRTMHTIKQLINK